MTQEQATTEQALKRTKIGTVISDKRDKTITVEVTFLKRHPKYGKFLQRSTRFHVHDENNECKMGDRVEIAECAPYSKTKSWRLVRIVESAPAAAV